MVNLFRQDVVKAAGFSITNSTGNISRSFGYDSHGRVSSVIETIPGTSTFTTYYGYNDLDRLSTITHPSGIVETLNYN